MSRNKFSRRAVLTGGIAAAGVLASPAILRAAPATLKISHFLPPKHGFQADFLAPWAKDLEERTGGEIVTEMYPGSTSFGNITRQADQVRAGVVDVCLGLRSQPRGRFSGASVIEIPFLMKEADTGARVMWDLFDQGAFANEFDDFKVLSLFTTSSCLIHTINQPVRSPDDMKGLRLRTPTQATSAMLQFMGSSPVGLPPSAIYEALQREVIDGLVTTWDLVGAIKLNEIVKYHTDARAAVTSFYVLMNKEKFAGLSPAAQQAIEETTGSNLLDNFGPWWKKWDDTGLQQALDANHEIIPMSDDERAAWKSSLEPMVTSYLDGLQGEGVADPKGIYEQVLQSVSKYEK
jgi:TRAP-type transport system periplasmic protein